MADKNNRPDELRQPNEFADVETRLETRLMRVSPDPEFIRSLHERLADRSELVLEPETHLRDLLLALAVAGGGILVLVSALRLVYEALRAVGILKTRG